MSSDTSQAMIRAEDVAEDAATAAQRTAEDQPAGMAEDAGQTEELLIEEISIDGMCGVY